MSRLLSPVTGESRNNVQCLRRSESLVSEAPATYVAGGGRSPRASGNKIRLSFSVSPGIETQLRPRWLRCVSLRHTLTREPCRWAGVTLSATHSPLRDRSRGAGPRINRSDRGGAGEAALRSRGSTVVVCPILGSCLGGSPFSSSMPFESVSRVLALLHF